MYTFIANPNARSGLGKKTWDELEPVLKARNIKYQVFFTKYQRHATQMARRLTAIRKRCTIIILGGDGTVNEVINGIDRLSDVTLGYIPIGSSNDFARGYGLSTDSVEALNHILAPSRFHYMNIGVLSYSNHQRQFAVSAGIGFDAEVCHQIVISRLKVFLNKLKLGKLSYAGVALQRIIAMQPGKMVLTLDDKKRLEFEKVYFITAMNNRFEGGGFKFCPKADPGDDLLDIIVISDISKLKLLALLPTAFSGLHTRFRGVHTFQCRKADIMSERALPLHTDGEPVFPQKHLTFTLAPEKIRIISS